VQLLLLLFISKRIKCGESRSHRRRLGGWRLVGGGQSSQIAQWETFDDEMQHGREIP
jgi:hypothetical protein